MFKTIGAAKSQFTAFNFLEAVCCLYLLITLIKLTTMEIVLTHEESEKMFHDALCNGGLSELSMSGIRFTYKKDDYEHAKKQLENPCYEDVLMQILKDGNKLRFVDEECDGEYSRSITLEDVHTKTCKTPFEHLSAYINEEDDATTAYILLQAILYDGEIIFG